MQKPDRAERLKELACRRKAAVLRDGVLNVADFQEGRYDCDFVSPYSKGACNIESPVLLILQDWVSAKMLSGEFLTDLAERGRLPRLRTNTRLDELLDTHLQMQFSELYATNLFPFIKPGGMSSAISQSLYDEAAQAYAIPQVEILQPRLAIAFGLNGFNALRRACGHVAYANIDDAIASPFDFGATRIWCQAHTGFWGQINRGKACVEVDWNAMSEWFRQHGAP